MKLRNLFRQKRNDKELPAVVNASPEEKPQPIFLRRRARFTGWFPDIRMRRGVQQAIERKQRSQRLAFIYQSMRQGVQVRNEFRALQLAGRAERLAAQLSA